MTAYLRITARFLTGRYHGAEWPPSPARLFRAMVAGVNTGGYRRNWEAAQAALQWLEDRPAPEIVAAPAESEPNYKLYVPNNDYDVAAREWAKGRDYEVAKLKTAKTLAPRRIGEPNAVHYLWPVESAAAPVSELREAARCLHTLGLGIDMAFADADLLTPQESQAVPGTRWTPTEGRGEQRLHVPIKGTLQDLTVAYHRFSNRMADPAVDPDTRATVFDVRAYRRQDELRRPNCLFALEMTGGRAHPAWYKSMHVAGWLRHAAAQALQNDADPAWIEQYVQGHGSDRSHRLSYLPLPSVGHAHSDARVRRVLICEPPDADGATTDLLAWKLLGSDLTDREGKAVARLTPDDGKMKRWYLDPGFVWKSVTPVVLPGHNMERRRFSPAKTERLILEALRGAGYPETLVHDLEYQPAPYWSGAGGALQMVTPDHLRQWPRVHVRVQFRSPVYGPVIAGLGRHYGIGLFARD
jgi:CRISPR-associated protein Csb2